MTLIPLPMFNPEFCELCIAVNSAQDIIEIMSDSSGQGTYCLHLPGMLQPGLKKSITSPTILQLQHLTSCGIYKRTNKTLFSLPDAHSHHALIPPLPFS